MSPFKRHFTPFLLLTLFLLGCCDNVKAMLPPSARFPQCVQFSPDGRFVAAVPLSYAWPNLGARVWLAQTGAIYTDFPSATGTWLAFSPDSRHIAFLQENGIRAYDLLSNTELFTLRTSIDAEQFWFAPDGKSVIVQGRWQVGRTIQDINGKIHKDSHRDFEIWTLPTNPAQKPTRTTQFMESPLFEVTYPASGPRLRAFTLQEQAKSLERCAPALPGSVLANSADGKWQAVSTYSTNTIQVWDRANCQLKYTFEGKADTLWFSPGGRTLVSAASNQPSIWDLSDGSHHTIEHNSTIPPAYCAISPDETTIAIANGQSIYRSPNPPALSLYDLRTGAPLASAQ